jgi:hypothetical protein
MNVRFSSLLMSLRINCDLSDSAFLFVQATLLTGEGPRGLGHHHPWGWRSEAPSFLQHQNSVVQHTLLPGGFGQGLRLAPGRKVSPARCTVADLLLLFVASFSSGPGWEHNLVLEFCPVGLSWKTRTQVTSRSHICSPSKQAPVSLTLAPLPVQLQQ